MVKETHLKAVEEVVEAPRNDDIVVERYEQGDNAGGDADATQPGMDLIPHAQGAESHLLADAELNEE